MDRRLRSISLILIMPFFLGGCGMAGKWFHAKPKKDKNAVPHDLFIGTIESINPEQHFVLIHTVMRTTIQAGSRLETRPATGNKSLLTITPEQKLNFLAADISEGFPQVGDAVVLPPQLPVAPVSGGSTPPIQLPLPLGGLPPPIH
ncbi:MAG: hypothetical protein WCN98_10275 [Verrucomicrobiaceae bacterium]